MKISFFILILLFFLGLVYLIYPIPKSIEDIPPLPGHVKSDEPGDTYQNPNIAGYYGDKRRKFVTGFYKNFYDNINILGFKIPSIKLNHPPEEAYFYIRDQQRSTYLEQYTYPLKSALYINGYEPFDEKGKRFDSGSYKMDYYGVIYPTKVTIRYYYSPLTVRLIFYLSYWVLGFFIYYLFNRAIKNA